MSRRFLLNCFIAFTLAGSYLLASSLLNLMASTDAQEDHAFSLVKRKADSHFNKNEFELASRYYKQLAQADPLNSGAHTAYAFGLTRQIEELLKISRGADDGSEEKQQLEARIEKLMVEAAEAYRNSLPFKRFRNFSRYKLSLILGFQGDYESAIDLLALALKDGKGTRGMYGEFKLYRCLDEVLKSPEITQIFQSGS